MPNIWFNIKTINYPVLKDAGLLLTFELAVRGVAALGTVDWAAR